jgi:hypothetical protein
MNLIEIFGPSYCYCNEILTEPTVIWVIDHHYASESKIYAINSLLTNSACNPENHLLVFDDFLACKDFEHYPHVCYPGRTTRQLLNFCKIVTDINWSNKKNCFNFMLNKVRPHRLILSRLVNYFDLHNYVYSQSWAKQDHFLLEHDTVSALDDDTVKKISDIEQQEQKRYLTNTQTQYKLNGYMVLDNVTLTNAEVYNKLLKTAIYESSYISLITEPLYHENETMITEKTVMAIFGGTIPIWVGGYFIADSMRNLGFDVFDDLIDHSYQQEITPFDRCYQAINKNLSVLQDSALLRQFFDNNQHRFQHNLNLLSKEKVLNRLCQQEIKKIPMDKIKNKLSNNLINLTQALLEN